MNGWGVAFLAPFIALIFIDPTYMVPALIGMGVLVAVMLWLVHKVIGPKK